MIPKGLNFRDFIRWSAECFEEQASEQWADDWLNDIKNFSVHIGDCTNYPHTCQLCLLQTFLKEYEMYTFNYEQFKIEIIDEKP